jgi:hypothetical protein
VQVFHLYSAPKPAVAGAVVAGAVVAGAVVAVVAVVEADAAAMIVYQVHPHSRCTILDLLGQH